MDNLHIFLGATVADAAARPLPWFYDSIKLYRYIKGINEVAFLNYLVGEEFHNSLKFILIFARRLIQI